MHTLVLFAYALLGGLNFDEGEWTLIGVSLPNYDPHPLTRQFPAFRLEDKNTLKTLQTLWQGEPLYEDYCDYHYVIKLYQGRQLKKTLKINLRCGYITEGVFSYTFKPEWLTQFQAAFKPVLWSRVWFQKNESLRRAVSALLEAPDVFFYEEPEPYLYTGRFILAVDSVPWYANRDSLYRAVEKQITAAFPPNKAYVRPYFFFLDDRFFLYFRFEVFCDEADFRKYGARLPVSVHWQPHIQPGEAKRLILIGVNRERFFAYVRSWQARHGVKLEMPD